MATLPPHRGYAYDGGKFCVAKYFVSGISHCCGHLFSVGVFCLCWFAPWLCKLYLVKCKFVTYCAGLVLLRISSHFFLQPFSLQGKLCLVLDDGGVLLMTNQDEHRDKVGGA